jgi:high-affinity iron transporter
MEAAAGAGQYRQAEQARLEAYAFFEFGPSAGCSRSTRARARRRGPDLVRRAGTTGLAKLIAKRAPRREIRETRLALDEQLADAAATLGDAASKATVVTNSAIIVFREGLEAVLILAAITASFVGCAGGCAGRCSSARSPAWPSRRHLGAGPDAAASLERYGEKLEAVVGLIAIGVLLLITNWFFHRVYWSEWIGKFHRRASAREARDSAASSPRRSLGLFVLGLTSVYREGFETVLFLQSLQLSAGHGDGARGRGLGLALTLAVGRVTFSSSASCPTRRC